MVDQSSSINEDEKFVREALIHVGLAAELNLELTGPIFQRAYSVISKYVERNGVQSISRLHRLFPSSTVFAISALAFEFGDGSEFWAKISEGTDSDYKLPFLNQQHQSFYGNAFRNSLKELNLATFAHVKGKLNLTPILLHAGLPVSSVGQVWKRLHDFVERGYEDGAEIVSLWRQDDSAMQYFTIPARKFIYESGRFAEDLIGRMVGVLIDVGTSRGILDLEKISRDNRVSKSLVQRLLSEDLTDIKRIKRVPSPRVFLNVLSGDGPQMLLPSLESIYWESSWRVTGSETITYPASRFDDQYVDLEPASRWSAELLKGGIRMKTREFRSLEGQSYWIFRSKLGFLELVDYSNALEDDVLTLLAPVKTIVKIGLPGIETVVEKAENYLVMGGEWTNYALFELPLFGAEKLLLQNFIDGTKLIEIPIIRAQGYPELSAQIALEVSDLEGRKTYCTIPRIRFTREVANLEKYEVTIYHAFNEIYRSPVSKLTEEDGEYRIDDVIHWQTGSYRIRILGPLGSDLVESFIFMPNVRYQENKKYYLPSGNITQLLLIDGHPPAVMEFPDGEDRITAELELDSEVLHFRLRIPRLLFCICEPNESPEFGSEIQNYTEDDFVNYASKGNLFLRFRDSINGTVQLLAGNRVEAAQDFAIKSGEELTKVELSSFRQDVRRSSSPTMELRVMLDDVENFCISKIETNFDGAISDLESHQVIDGCVTAIEFQMDESLRKHQLQLVIINEDEPWKKSQYIALEESRCEFRDIGNGTFSVIAQLDEILVPSNYLTGLAFNGAMKIIESSASKIRIGTKSDLQLYMNLLTDDGIGLANGVIRGKYLPRGRVLSTAEYRDGVRNVGRYLLAHTESDLNSNEYKPAIAFLLHEGQTTELVGWFCEVLSDKDLKSSAEKLLIAIFPQFCDSPLEGDDAQLRQRLWRTSPLMGTAMTYDLDTPEVVQERNHWLGILDFERIPIEGYSNTRLSELKKIGQLQFQNQKLASSDFLKYAVINFILQNSSSEQISEIEKFNLEAEEILGDYLTSQEVNSQRLKQLKVSQTLRHRNSVALSAFPYNVQQLSMLMVNNVVPYALSNQAADLLSDQMELAKSLVMSSLITAIIETRIQDLA